MAETSQTPDEPQTPVPPGGGAGERLREFLAARQEPSTVDDDEQKIEDAEDQKKIPPDQEE